MSHKVIVIVLSEGFLVHRRKTIKLSFETSRVKENTTSKLINIDSTTILSTLILYFITQSIDVIVLSKGLKVHWRQTFIMSFESSRVKEQPHQD